MRHGLNEAHPTPQCAQTAKPRPQTPCQQARPPTTMQLMTKRRPAPQSELPAVPQSHYAATPQPPPCPCSGWIGPTPTQTHAPTPQPRATRPAHQASPDESSQARTEPLRGWSSVLVAQSAVMRQMSSPPQAQRPAAPWPLSETTRPRLVRLPRLPSQPAPRCACLQMPAGRLEVRPHTAYIETCTCTYLPTFLLL